MTDDEVKRVADGLTDAMKRAVMWLPSDGGWRDHRRKPKSNDGVRESSLYFINERIIGKPDKAPVTIYRLAISHPASGDKERGQIWANTRWRATPLGLAVRAYLERQSSKENV